MFTEGLLKPSLEFGELARLTDQMIMIDPSLEQWNSYLTAACRYFVKNKLHHVLYEFQLFMKVGINICVKLPYLGLYMRKADFVACKQQRCRLDCPFAQSD